MKKLLCLLVLTLTLLTGCNKEPHWSYQACIDELIPNGVLTSSYTYTVKEIEHHEIAKGDDEIYCFDITITKGAGNMWGEPVRYCCFAVVSDGEVVYVDCDRWEHE